MKLFNFNKNKSKDKSKQTKQNKKKSTNKSKFGLFKNKDDFIGRSGIGAAVESAVITAIQANLTNDDQPYIAIDNQSHLIYLIALTNDLMKGSMFEKDSEALGSLQAATENSNKNISNDGDIPGSVYNASFPSDIEPQANAKGETPPKQLVFLPTINTLNELETIAGADQEYEIVSMPSDISESNYLDYVDKGLINLPIEDYDDEEEPQDESVDDTNSHLIKVTIAGFKDFVKDNTTIDSTNAYDDFEDDDTANKDNDELENDDSDDVLLDDEDENGDDSSVPTDPYSDSDLDDDDTSFEDPFDDDSFDDDSLDDTDDADVTDDTDDTDVPDTDDTDVLDASPKKAKKSTTTKKPKAKTKPAAVEQSVSDDDTDLDDTDFDDTDLDDTDFDDDNLDDNFDDDHLDDEYNDELDLDVPDDTNEASDMDDANEAKDTDDANEAKNANKTSDTNKTNEVKDEDETSDTDEANKANATDNLDYQDAAENIRESHGQTVSRDDVISTAPAATDTAKSTNVIDNSSQAESTVETATNEGSTAPQVSTSAPSTSNMSNIRQQQSDKFIRDVTNVHPSDVQNVLPSSKPAEGEELIDVTNPEVSLAKIDPSLKKMTNLTDRNRKAREQLRNKYSKQIDTWLKGNLHVPVLYIKDSEKLGKKFLIEQQADNEMLRNEAENQRENIKMQLMNKIDSILDGLTDPVEFDKHFPEVAEKLRSKFLNKKVMKQEQIERMNQIERSYEQLEQALRNAAIDKAEQEFNTKYIPKRDEEITSVESAVNHEHQKAHSKAVDEILATVRDKAQPLVDEQVKDIILGGQSLVDSAAISLSGQTRAYSKELFKRVRIQTAMNDSTLDNDSNQTQPEQPAANQIDHQEFEGRLYQKQQELEQAHNQIAELQNQLNEKSADNENLRVASASAYSREAKLMEQIKKYQNDMIAAKAEKTAAAQRAASYQQNNNALLDELTNLQNHGSKGQELNYRPDTVTPVATTEQNRVETTQQRTTPEPVEPEKESPAPKSSPAHAPQL